MTVKMMLAVNVVRAAAVTNRTAASQPAVVEPTSNLSQFVEEFATLSETSNVQQMSPPPKPQTSPQPSESMLLINIGECALAEKLRANKVLYCVSQAVV